MRHVTSHRFSPKCDYCKMAGSRFEKSLDVSEISEESEAAEAERNNDETLAEYPQAITSFAFVKQGKSNEARNYSFLSFRGHVVFV